MANGTYGSEDALFSIPKAPGKFKYYTIVNPVTKISELKRSDGILVGTYDFNTSKYKPTDSRFNDVVNPNDKNAVSFIVNQSVNATSNGIFKTLKEQKKPITEAQAKSKAQQLLTPQKANPDQKPPAGTDSKADPTSPQGGGYNKDNDEAIAKAISEGDVEGTKTKKFGDLIYPIHLNQDERDCIRFTIIEYTARTLSLSRETQELRRSIDFNKQKNLTIAGSVTLPIPGGISDRNMVDWQNDQLSNIQSGVGQVINQFLTRGADAAGKAAEEQIKNVVGGDPKLLDAVIATQTTQAALGTGNLMARQYGAILNPNMELLFNAPTLRDFSFQFRMTPRSQDEAERVRTIIRTFKKEMAPRRSTSVILLKTPLIFNIQYLSKNKDHPYLNKFKQCALINCSVNYTPDGTYSVYEDSSMTCYELNLGFQELQPIYNDDYGDNFNESKPAPEVGY